MLMGDGGMGGGGACLVWSCDGAGAGRNARTWSDLHPETPIEPGSTLYSVNTIRGFQAMQDELRKARQLVLVVIPPQRKG